MITQFGVHIKTKNIYKSLEFYSLFNIKPTFAYGDDTFLKLFAGIPTATEKYNGILFNVGGSVFELADGHVAVKPEVFKETIKSSKLSLMLYVNSIDEVLDICNKKSLPILVPIKTYPWGTKELVVKDPDGLILVFIERTT